MTKDRDYRKLTAEEEAQWGALKNRETISKTDTITIRKSFFYDYPEAVRRHLQLFPNHYLDPAELRDRDTLQSKLLGLKILLNNKSTTERDILNEINLNKHFYIIGSILKDKYNFGHHEAHIFPEFPLGTSYKVDYLILGRNSDGWHFIFTELEAPHGGITTKDGRLGNAFRKGLTQTENWNIWLEQNFSSLQEYFRRHISLKSNLPDELCRLDKSRINYAIIAGRRNDFNEITYRIRREAFRRDQTLLLHYDNLLDSVDSLCLGGTY